MDTAVVRFRLSRMKCAAVCLQELVNLIPREAAAYSGVLAPDGHRGDGRGELGRLAFFLAKHIFGMTNPRAGEDGHYGIEPGEPQKDPLL